MMKRLDFVKKYCEFHAAEVGADIESTRSMYLIQEWDDQHNEIRSYTLAELKEYEETSEVKV